jgi:MarR family transcriptional regulator, transcriptional regulator for hemolysin
MKEHSKLYTEPLDHRASAGYMTNCTARLFARAIDRRLKPLGLASGQLPVFFALSASAALSQKALARAATIEQPTMAATLARMERDGLVRKEPDPKDRRSALYSLTPMAVKNTAQIRAAVETVNAEALSGLDKHERAALLAILEKVAGTLEASLAAQD